MSKSVWIPYAVKSKSALRSRLHVPVSEPIRMETLQKIKNQEVGSHVSSYGKSVPVTKALKKKATLAMTLKKLQKKQK